MTSIIEELLVTLGLDASDFKKGSGDVKQTSKDLKDSIKKDGDEVEAGARRQADAFSKLRGELVSMLAVYVTAKGAMSFALGSMQNAAAVGRTAQLYAMNTRTVSAWGDALKAAGGSAQDAAGYFGRLSEIRANFARHPDQNNLYAMSQLGIKSQQDLYDEEGLAYTLADNYQQRLARAKATGNPDAEKLAGDTFRQNVQEVLGLSGDFVTLIMQGRDPLREQIEYYKEHAAVTLEDAKNAREAAQAFEHLSASFDHLFRRMGGLAIVRTTADLFDWLASYTLKLNDSVRAVSLGFFALTHPLTYLLDLMAQHGLISPTTAKVVGAAVDTINPFNPLSPAGIDGQPPDWMLHRDNGGAVGNVANPGSNAPSQYTGGVNYDAVLGNGRFGTPGMPISQMTVQQAIAFGESVLRPNSRAAGVGRDRRGLVGSSAVGAYQFTGETLAAYGPRLFGANWRNQRLDAAAQERLAEAIWNDARNGDVHSIFSSLPAGNYRNVSFAQIRARLAHGESGRRAAAAAPPPAWASNYEAAARLMAPGHTEVHVTVHAPGAQDAHKIAHVTGHAVAKAVRPRSKVANANTGMTG